MAIDESKLWELPEEKYKYTSQLDPATGLMKGPYKFDPNQSEAFSQIRSRAMSQGPSTWANMMLQKQNMETQGLQDQAAQQQRGAQAGALSSLAMRGGIGGGARTRLASQGAKDLLFANQAAARQGSMGKFNILGQDEQQKQQLLSGVADTELKSQQGNIQAALEEKRREEADKLRQYESQMQSWASEKQAQAAERSKGK